MSERTYNYLNAAMVCSFASCFCAYQFMLQGASAVMVPELMAELGIDLANIGLLSSSFLYIYLLFQVPGGYIADRYSARKLLLLCTLLLAVASFWFGHADSLLEACMARGLMGIATAPGIVICLNLVGRWFPERWFCLLAGLVEAIALFGGALGPLFLTQVVASVGWRETMIWVAVAGVCLAVVNWLVVRDKPLDIDQTGLELQAWDEHCHMDEGHFDRMAYIWLCLFGFGLFAMISSFGGLWGIPFLETQFPGQEAQVANTVSLLFIGTAIGAPLLGAVSAMFGRVRLIMLGSVLSALLMTGLLIFCDCSLASKAMLSFLAGFSFGGYMLVFSQVKQIGRPRSQGMVLAGANGSMLLAGPVLQPFIGCILDKRGVDESVLGMLDFQLSFIPLLLAQLLALLAVVALLRR